ncbi:MAG: Ig-like domain-containing protein [Gemmatimonadaceae bacterium]|nr:Ig-like domain-containing protein [Gemmatimonadaceae bacterium]
MRLLHPFWSCCRRACRPAPLLALCAVLAAACGGSSDTGGTGTTGPNGSAAAPTISLSTSALAVSGLGSSATLSATIAPASATISWTSSDAAVATVTGNGTTASVTGIAAGSAQITATASSGGRSATAVASVTVTPVVRSITIAEPTVTLLAGTAQRLTATVTADVGAVRTLQWRSDDPTVATVDSSGTITAVAAGTTTVRATSLTTPAVSASVPVRVNAVPRVRSIVVTPSVDSAFVGQLRAFTAVVAADSGVATTVVWRSSAPGVASVDANGRATAVAAGTTTLSAVSTVDSTVRASATLAVRLPVVRSVSFTLPPALLAGRSVDAISTISADPGADTRVTWSSTAPTVASVDANGRVTALAAGTTTITLRSVAFPSVTASTVLTVSTPPTTSVFAEVPIGSGGGLTTATINGIFATSAGQGVVLADGSAPNIAGVEAPLQMGAPTWQLRTDLMSSFRGRFGMDAAGSSPSDIFWSLAGDTFSGLPSVPLVVRWDGATLTSTNWPLPSGVSSPFVRALASIGAGEALALSSTGAIHRYRGGAWSALTPSSSATFGTGLSAWTGDSAIITRCQASTTDSRLAVFRGGTITLLPNTTIGDDPTFPGCARSPLALPGGDFVVALDRSVARYSGGTFTEYTPSLDQGEWFYELTLCGATLYAGTSRGRIFRASGTTLTLVADAGQAATETTGAMRCAPDGTLRVGSAQGLVTRLAGGVWTDEHYAPTLWNLSLQSADAGMAVGVNGSIWRWNGAQWNWIRRTSRESLGEAYLAPDGTMFAGGSFTRNNQTVGQLLRSSGGAWVREELAVNEQVQSLWGASSSMTFALSTDVSGIGRIWRFDGSSWSVSATTSTALYAVHGSSPVHAIAVGNGGIARQWNGSTWSAMPNIPVGNSRVRVQSVLTFSPTLAYAGAPGCDSFTPGGLWRWNGTAWVDAGLTAAGLPNCVSAIFGADPNDVFAVVQAPAGSATVPDRLVRWNGSSWSVVAVTLANDYRSGAAIPGLTMLVGRTGRVLVGRVPGAVRAGVSSAPVSRPRGR